MSEIDAIRALLNSKPLEDGRRALAQAGAFMNRWLV
jgi:hypothetical protein